MGDGAEAVVLRPEAECGAAFFLHCQQKRVAAFVLRDGQGCWDGALKDALLRMLSRGGGLGAF